MGAAVAVVVHGQPGRLGGGGLFAGQGGCFFGFADLGGHDVQDPAAQDPQPLRVVMGGFGEQVVTGLGHHVGPDRVG